jgi:hypothetical protein
MSDNQYRYSTTNSTFHFQSYQVLVFLIYSPQVYFGRDFRKHQGKTHYQYLGGNIPVYSSLADFKYPHKKANSINPLILYKNYLQFFKKRSSMLKIAKRHQEADDYCIIQKNDAMRSNVKFKMRTIKLRLNYLLLPVPTLCIEQQNPNKICNS